MVNEREKSRLNQAVVRRPDGESRDLPVDDYVSGIEVRAFVLASRARWRFGIRSFASRALRGMNRTSVGAGVQAEIHRCWADGWVERQPEHFPSELEALHERSASRAEHL
jgi:hypothetical protein